MVLSLYTVTVYGTETPPPNVVLIVADDLGYCDSELYGCEDVPTPNLLRIADEGVLFKAGYVTCLLYTSPSPRD